jgi:hypothetical protein
MKPSMILTTALLSGLALPALATTHASLSLSNFSTVLKDLNAGDGKAPEISWGGGYATTNSEDRSQLGWKMGSDFANIDWSSESRQQQSAWTTPGLSTVSQHGNGTQQVKMSDFNFEELKLDANAAVGHNVSSGAMFGQNFTLAAGTQATFSVTANSILSGPGYVGPWTAPANWNGDASSYSAVYADLRIGSFNTGLSGMGSSSWIGQTDEYESIIDGQIMKLTIKNSSLVDKSYSLNLSGNAQAWEAAAPVPEPESYAMFGAGLLLLGAVARRRKG